MRKKLVDEKNPAAFALVVQLKKEASIFASVRILKLQLLISQMTLDMNHFPVNKPVNCNSIWLGFKVYSI